MLYLSPVPVTPIEKLTEKLYNSFPHFSDKKFGFPIYHMTIAFGQKIEENRRIIEEYFAKFGKTPLVLKAGKIGIYIKKGNDWSEYISFDLG
ncbi:hypothetical protein Hore_13620 [Halothermothrix orenii H 168]|uniref:2'-5' RNA ligase n=1 Tax=Halothermothrix orenii (strain H 168 / OCM 544 / DSM 9562) TaxID=373903 RepID=B8CXU3_HALOH|nr:hypothetical protein Hore_13620 [Halothermothrix orenii H 168]